MFVSEYFGLGDEIDKKEIFDCILLLWRLNIATFCLSKLHLLRYLTAGVIVELLRGFVESLDQSENDFDEGTFETRIRTIKEIIAEFAGDNPKLSRLLTQVVDGIEKDKERFLGQDISVMIGQMRYSAIDAEIKRYAKKWYLDFEDVRYEALHFRDGELANENKLKDSADYAAYKERNEHALPKFKFRKQMIDEFKNDLMPEIEPLIG